MLTRYNPNGAVMMKRYDTKTGNVCASEKGRVLDNRIVLGVVLIDFDNVRLVTEKTVAHRLADFAPVVIRETFKLSHYSLNSKQVVAYV